jgi:hypothetical protein
MFAVETRLCGDCKVSSGAHGLRIVYSAFETEIKLYVRSDVFTAGTAKNSVFLDVTPFASCKTHDFRRKYRLYHQGEKNLRSRNNNSCN